MLAPMISVIFSILISVEADPTGRGGYPSEWWRQYSRATAPDWEILPQEAGSGEVILSKRTELGILSNFAATPFVLDGKSYASVEGFWQMMKYPENEKDLRAKAEWKLSREQVGQLTGFEAKAAGTAASKIMKTMNINWVSYRAKRMRYRTPERAEHYRTILRAMKAKLSQNPKVKEVLKRTGDLVLRPDHHQKAAPPAWEYHKIWMELRAQLPK